MDERLKKQLDFALEIDKEKNIFRQTNKTAVYGKHKKTTCFSGASPQKTPKNKVKNGRICLIFRYNLIKNIYSQ